MSSRSNLAPLSPFSSLMRGLEFPGTLEQLFHRTPFEGSASWSPKVDVTEDEHGYIVRAEVPGMQAEDFELRVTGDLLTLKGEKHEEKRDESETRHVLERSYGAFERSFTLPTPVDASRVEAEAKDGVLHIRVPKAETARSHKVKVKKG